jgi:DNA-directed RNA polymerase I subunit RPA2
VQAYGHRTDGKLYRVQTPQKPLARTKQYDELTMDEYPQGTNMVVCVIAYTGYDMEDAMILNKSAVERGLAHGCIYKTESVNLKDTRCGPARHAHSAHMRVHPATFVCGWLVSLACRELHACKDCYILMSIHVLV